MKKGNHIEFIRKQRAILQTNEYSFIIKIDGEFYLQENGKPKIWIIVQIDSMPDYVELRKKMFCNFCYITRKKRVCLPILFYIYMLEEK